MIDKLNTLPVATNTHGGPGRGQGRHKEPGYVKALKLRFLNTAEEEALEALKLTPRQRVEVLLAAQADPNSPAFC